MKVSLTSAVPFGLSYGGLEIQILRTAEALRALGVEVELLDPWRRDFDADLLHCFSSEYQLAELVTRARGRGIPVVTSAVFSPKRRVCFYRAWRHLDRAMPLKTSYGMRREILGQSAAVVALTQAEAEDLIAFFEVPRGAVCVIGNGVDAAFFNTPADRFTATHKLAGFVLCVASLDSYKNQLRLVEAMEDIGCPLVLIGAANTREPAYAAEVAAYAERTPHVHWLGPLPDDSPLLASAFAAAHTVVLPSLTEGQPLVALQAAAAGANLVLSDLRYLRAGFGGYPWYCNPRSVGSIRSALRAARAAPRGERYTDRPDWLLTWAEVAVRLKGVYESVLAGRSVTPP